MNDVGLNKIDEKAIIEKLRLNLQNINSLISILEYKIKKRKEQTKLK